MYDFACHSWGMRTAGPSVAGETARLARLGGVAAFLGGLAWTLKGAAILVGGAQPPLLFELAPVLFGSGLLSVAYSTMPSGRRRSTALGLASVTIVAGLAALASDLAGKVAGAALAISSVGLLLGLLTLERSRRWPAPLAWWIGVAMVPAVLVGGLLAELDERLLEIPLVCLGVAWMAVGFGVLLQPRASEAPL